MSHTYVLHGNEGAFQPATPGIFVRDLGVGDLTGGELTAQVVRIEPEGAYVEELHRHDEGFSLAYVLQGWLDVEFEEIGIQHLGLGTVIPAFNGPRHHELACGDGFELLLLVTRKSMTGDDKQRIVVQQERDAPYGAGLRDYFQYRNFGLSGLADGRMVAQAIKVLPGVRPRRQWHVRIAQPGDRRHLRDMDELLGLLRDPRRIAPAVDGDELNATAEQPSVCVDLFDGKGRSIERRLSQRSLSPGEVVDGADGDGLAFRLGQRAVGMHGGNQAEDEKEAGHQGVHAPVRNRGFLY